MEDLKIEEEIEDYEVVRASGVISEVFTKLRSRVMQKSVDGWKPLGGVTMSRTNAQNVYVCQAMYKPKSENGKDEKQLLNG